MKEKTAWFLACGFFAGYIFAWGAIALDRHLILESQSDLQQKLNQTRQELRLAEIVFEAEIEMNRDIEWNRHALEEIPRVPDEIREKIEGKKRKIGGNE